MLTLNRAAEDLARRMDLAIALGFPEGKAILAAIQARSPAVSKVFRDNSAYDTIEIGYKMMAYFIQRTAADKAESQKFVRRIMLQEEEKGEDNETQD